MSDSMYRVTAVSKGVDRKLSTTALSERFEICERSKFPSPKHECNCAMQEGLGALTGYLFFESLISLLEGDDARDASTGKAASQRP